MIKIVTVDIDGSRNFVLFVNFPSFTLLIQIFLLNVSLALMEEDVAGSSVD